MTDLVPQSLSYFERFVGPNPGTHKNQNSIFMIVLVPYRKALLNRDVRAGLDICCLGALRDDLPPGQWVTELDNDVVWDALSSCHATSNPFSLLGALDVALYRQEDERFREFAAAAVTTLLDERFGQPEGVDIYSLLQMLYEFVLNRLNLLENGATYPGYWKRMGAWMQARPDCSYYDGAILSPSRSTIFRNGSTGKHDRGRYLCRLSCRLGRSRCFLQATFYCGMKSLVVSMSLHHAMNTKGAHVPRSEDVRQAHALRPMIKDNCLS